MYELTFFDFLAFLVGGSRSSGYMYGEKSMQRLTETGIGYPSNISSLISTYRNPEGVKILFHILFKILEFNSLLMTRTEKTMKRSVEIFFMYYKSTLKNIFSFC